MSKKIRISNFINKEYRDYAIYTISSRGIPNVNDCLTPSQRLILLSAPKSFNKTLSLVGDVMGTGFFHHGDSSLTGTITKMAKDFQSSTPLLIGDGFFGTITNHTAASARYTSIKINSKISNIIDEFKHLNNKTPEGNIETLNCEIPVGLMGMSLGISVGFATKILPRNLNELIKFMKYKEADLKPYFNNWNGEIVQYEGKGNVWLFKGQLSIEGNKITYSSIPPFMQYSSFLKKISIILNKIGIDNVELINRCTDQIDLELVVKNSELFDNIKEDLIKANQMIFTENIVLVDNRTIVEYANIIDYLKQFRTKNKIMYYNDIKYNINKIQNEIKINQYIIEFLLFMMEKKRLLAEIESFYFNYDKSIVSIFDSIKLRNLNIEYLEKLKSENINKTEQLVILNKQVNEFDLPTDFCFSSSKSSSDGVVLDLDIEEFEIAEEEEIDE